MTKPGSGLRGKDKQQGTLRDERNGTYVSTHTNRRSLPEGLVRKRVGPYSKPGTRQSREAWVTNDKFQHVRTAGARRSSPISARRCCLSIWAFLALFGQRPIRASITP
jgi:hypothetical protein